VSSLVSIVVVNYNGEKFIRRCVDSILSQSVPPCEVIVVDNNSNDESLQVLQHLQDPRLRILSLSKNTGYAAGCNAGIQESYGELVAVLNNDVVLDRDWLKALLDYNSPKWSFWASRIEFSTPAGRIDSAGDGMAIVGTAFKIGHGDPVEKHLTSGEVFGPCGAAALYRRNLLETVGGFDQDYFLVYEDADLNFRARLLGFRCFYVADARVIHQVNTNIGTFSNAYVYYGHRNSEYTFWTNMPTRLLLLYLPERILFNLFSLVFFAWKGQLNAFLKSKRSALKDWRLILKKRKKVQKDRISRIEEIRHYLERNWLKYRFKISDLS
jgi:GT2 family glycosyltransferase